MTSRPLLIDASVLGPEPEKGAQRYARCVIESFRHLAGWEVAVVVRDGAAPFEAAGVTAVPTKIGSRRSWLAHGLRRYMREHDVSFVLALGEGPIRLSPDQRAVVTVHEIPRLGRITTPRQLAAAAFDARHGITGQCLRRVHRIAALSHDMAERIGAHYRLGQGRVRVVPPGLDHVPLATIDDRGSDGTAGDAVHAVLFATGDGREHPLTAVEGLARVGGGVRVSVVGRTPDALRSAIAEVAAAGDVTVEFRGFVVDDELWRLLGTATCVIETSDYEGYGLQVGEAMRAGCPVLLPDMTVFREFALEEWQYWDGSHQSLRRAVETLRTVDRTDLARRQQTLIEPYTWLSTLTSLLALCDDHG